RNRLRVECKGHFRYHQGATFADQEVRTAGVANLRISRSGRHWISVEGRSGQRNVRSRRDPHPHAWCRERIAWSPAWQVGRQEVRTAERGIDEVGRVLADVKFIVERDLAEAERGLTVEQLLLQPQIVKAGRWESLDSADG